MKSKSIPVLYPFRFSAPADEFNADQALIVLIGAGGTGGYIVPDLLRWLSEIGRNAPVLIIDGDKVESKNLNRQNFVEQDLGKNKAEVLATRYSAHFPIQTLFFPEYIKDGKQLRNLVQTVSDETGVAPGFGTVFLGCVDNNKTRAIISSATLSSPGATWIDAGNTESYGQVIVSGPKGGPSIDQVLKSPPQPARYAIPNFFANYPESVEKLDKSPAEMSCAEMAESAPQSMMVNRMAANWMMSLLSTILGGKDLYINGVEFNTSLGSSRPLFLTADHLMRTAANLQKLSLNKEWQASLKSLAGI